MEIEVNPVVGMRVKSVYLGGFVVTALYDNHWVALWNDGTYCNHSYPLEADPNDITYPKEYYLKKFKELYERKVHK